MKITKFTLSTFFFTVCISVACIASFFAGSLYENSVSLKKGYECATLTQSQLKDYQIDLYRDTIWVYDGERLVSKYVTNFKGQIDSILLDDNQ